MIKKVNIIKIFLLFLNYINIVNSYKLCVVGGSSGLGREIIYQSLEKNYKVLALTNNQDDIKVPYRGGGLSNKETIELLNNDNLTIDNYDNSNLYNFENIIFTTSAQPFENDYSDVLTENILNKCESSLKNIIMISAYGVGETLQNSNLGIKVMNNWYLNDVYRAKNEQESFINKYGKNNNINTVIMRPKALSYGINMYSARSRESLASDILKIL